MTDPIDPDSIPILTDVIVPGRPPIGRQGETGEQEPREQREAHEAHAVHEVHEMHQSAPAAPAAPTARDVVGQPPVERPHDPAAVAPAPAGAPPSSHPLDARDVELIAERMRTRFSSYLRQEARGAIEVRCRDAVEEHTNWLVRQVTRDVLTALEAEVANWVRDAVREELGRHKS